jgi:membrane associated rhomboid family serine protease
MVRPGSSAPTATWSILIAVAVIWIAGFFTANLPFMALAALPDSAWQVWRFFTSGFVYPSIPDVRPIIGIIISALFFVLTAPGVERQLGRQRFLVLFFAASAFGAAAMVLAGAAGYGLGGALWGMLGAYLVIVWPHPAARSRFLILMAVYLLISLLFGGYNLPAIIGGAMAGVGTSVLFRRYDDRPRSNPRTPYLLIAAGVGGLILIAILRVLVLS